MMNVYEKAKSVFSSMNFEVADTSFDGKTNQGELKYLKPLKNIKGSLPLDIIKYFPKYFVLHKYVEPKTGGLFVVFLNDINDEAQYVYKKYFPKQIAVISELNGNLYAKWLHKKDKVVPLERFIAKITNG